MTLSIEDFQLGRLLGRGGFGNVYAATYGPKDVASGRRLPREVAIKMIDKNLINATQMSSRVFTEIQLHLRLSHPHILSLFAHFEDDHYVYLVMELCPNGELYSYLQHRKRLPEDETRFIARQIVEAVQYLHSNGILHRDLKLSNLLLNKNMDIKIADFGLAVALKHPHAAEQKTMCGTPNYISPEIISRQPYGLASDVWSLGCLFYTLLVGSPPFESAAVKQTLDKVTRVDYDLPLDLSCEARDLITLLLQKDPRKRITIKDVLRHPFFKLPSKALLSEQHHQGPTKNSFVQESDDRKIQRLKPLKQKTKHGVVEIHSSQHLILDFENDPNRMVLCPDGKTVKIFTNHCGNATWDPEKATAKATYSVDALPSSLLKKYRYAVRFLDVVKSKTPKIVLYTVRAKCYFMENTPDADIDVTFTSPPMKLTWSVSKSLLIVKPFPASSSSPQSISLSDYKPFQSNTDIHTYANMQDDKVPGEIIMYWRHVVDCYKQCWDMNRVRGRRSDTSFPIVLKIGAVEQTSGVSHAASSSGPGTSTGTGTGLAGSSPGLGGRGRSDVSVGAVSVYMSDVSSLKNGRRKRESTSRPPSTTLTARSLLPNSNKENTVEGRTREGGNEERKTTTRHMYLKDVGWCVQTVTRITHGEKVTEATEFTMLMNDGTKLVIEASSSGSTTCFVQFVNQRDDMVRLPIDKKLPSEIKHRLVHFPKFVNMFQIKST